VRVIKIGGGCLKDNKTIETILNLLAERGKGNLVVVSALNGITDFLIEGMQRALVDEANIADVMTHYQSRHTEVARYLIRNKKTLDRIVGTLSQSFRHLERLFFGLNFTREVTPRLYDTIASFGERTCAQLLVSVLVSRSICSLSTMPQDMGLITDSKYGDATADLKASQANFNKNLLPLIKKDAIVFMPGFYGVSRNGDITTFGRGGSDYSAAVAATALNAEVLEIWKDVDGFMSADPRIVPESRLIPELSYEEAAELAYFGAKILHPRTMEPVRKRKIPVTICNFENPEVEGTFIKAKSLQPSSVIKSIAYDTTIGILKIYASGVGARMGILAQVANAMTDEGINIRSVVTSQTCISLLLDESDLDAGRKALLSLRPRPFRRLKTIAEVALISIVGEGLSRKKGIAARCFTAVAGCNVNVEMIAFGPSRAALYFLVSKNNLNRAVVSIHSTFFSTPRCN
jgi:aspartate kinase